MVLGGLGHLKSRDCLVLMRCNAIRVKKPLCQTDK
jgi:hypothetical protein